MTLSWPNGGTTPPVFYKEANGGFRWTSAFGLRRHPVTGVAGTFHYGLDLIGWSDILAPTDGVITFAGYNGAAGYEVRMRADGPNAFIKGDVYRMLHNRQLLVKTGQRVKQRQKVAVMGTTGSSTGVHCHFETRPKGGNAVEPIAYMRARIPAGPANTPNKPPAVVPGDEDDMAIIIAQIEGNSAAAKAQVTHNRRARLITKYENKAYRAAQAQDRSAVIYVDLSKADFDALVAGKD